MFGTQLLNTDFSGVYSLSTSSQMVTELQKILQKIVEDTFPLKSIIISSEDQPWFNEELRKLKRLRLMEYNRHGKSKKYLELQDTFDRKFQNELQKYRAKIELEVTEGKRGSTYSALKKLGLRPGESVQPGFPNMSRITYQQYNLQRSLQISSLRLAKNIPHLMLNNCHQIFNTT